MNSQAFIQTAAKILQKIQEGVFDVSNEVNNSFSAAMNDEAFSSLLLLLSQASCFRICLSN